MRIKRIKKTSIYNNLYIKFLWGCEFGKLMQVAPGLSGFSRKPCPLGSTGTWVWEAPQAPETWRPNQATLLDTEVSWRPRYTLGPQKLSHTDSSHPGVPNSADILQICNTWRLVNWRRLLRGLTVFPAPLGPTKIVRGLKKVIICLSLSSIPKLRTPWMLIFSIRDMFANVSFLNSWGLDPGAHQSLAARPERSKNGS